MTTDTQPAPLPEPDIMCDCGGNYYEADTVRALMAERDAARRDADLAWQAKAVAMEVAAAEIAALRQKLDFARDALEHYQHGGSEYRKIAARALEAIGNQIPPDAREGREPLPASHAEFWLANRAKILDAIAREGLTLVSNRYGFELLMLGKFEAQGGPAGTRADGETQP